MEIVKRKPEEFRLQAALLNIVFWPSHLCTICRVAVGTEIKNGEASYRSSCDCGSEPNHSHGWEHVADRYNMQNDPAVIKEMDEFWGFTNNIN